MKKIIAVIFCVILSVFAISCKDIAKFTDLKNNETLYVGQNILENYDDGSVTTDSYLTYVKSRTYTLSRSSYNGYTDSVYYNGYYYYLSYDETTGQELLGTKTISTRYYYSYLISGNGEMITVKKTTVTTYTYSYDTKTIEKPCNYTLNLSGYFTVNSFKTALPSLWEKVNTSTTELYQINAETRINTSINRSSYKDTHFYVEKKR